MNKLIKISSFFVAAITLIVYTACENPVVDVPGAGKASATVEGTLPKSSYDESLKNFSYKTNLTAPYGNVSSYALQVKGMFNTSLASKDRQKGDTVTAYVALSGASVSSFPSDLTITGANILTALGRTTPFVGAKIDFKPIVKSPSGDLAGSNRPDSKSSIMNNFSITFNEDPSSEASVAKSLIRTDSSTAVYVVFKVPLDPANLPTASPYSRNTGASDAGTVTPLANWTKAAAGSDAAKAVDSVVFTYTATTNRYDMISFKLTGGKYLSGANIADIKTDNLITIDNSVSRPRVSFSKLFLNANDSSIVTLTFLEDLDKAAAKANSNIKLTQVFNSGTIDYTLSDTSARVFTAKVFAKDITTEGEVNSFGDFSGGYTDLAKNPVKFFAYPTDKMVVDKTNPVKSTIPAPIVNTLVFDGGTTKYVTFGATYTDATTVTVNYVVIDSAATVATTGPRTGWKNINNIKEAAVKKKGSFTSGKTSFTKVKINDTDQKYKVFYYGVDQAMNYSSVDSLVFEVKK